MPYNFPIEVELDIAEPRILKDRLTVTAGGRKERQAWWLEGSSGVWRDPVRRRVMLSPLCTTAAWRTTTTGNYARLAKADYTLTTPSAWVENHRGVSGNIYLEGNGTNERVTTSTTWGADQGFFLSVYVPDTQSLGEQTILECGWGTPGAAGTISIRFRANGGVSYWDGATQIGYDDLDYASANKNPLLGSVGLSTVNIILLPMKVRNTDGTVRAGELLITTDAGTGVVYGMENTGSDPIVPAAAFWWQVPIGRPSVLCAPLKFETSGTLYGPLQKLRYAPASGRSFSGRGFYSTAGSSPTATYSLIDSTGASYTADGTIDSVRGKVAFSGDGSNSVCVEAVDWVMARETTDTDDSEKVNITTLIEGLEINLDDHGVATCEITMRRGAMEDAGVEGWLELSDRPFRIYSVNPDDNVKTDIMRGTLGAPEWRPADGLGNGDTDLLVYNGRDRSQELAYYQFGDTVSDDGKLITDALEDILTTAGFDSSDLVLSTSTATVPISDPGMGEWAFLPQRGETAEEYLNALRDKLIANWWLGWVPTLAGYKWRGQAPDDLSDTPAITLYESEEDAIAAGATAAQALHRTIRRIVRYGYPPEANQVIVLGQDRYTGLTILSQSNDTASQTPTTAPSGRPITWRGRVHRVLEIDPSYSTQAKADSVKSILYERLASERYLIDWTSDFLHVAASGRPLWTGDVVRLYLQGRAKWEDYRIVGLPSIRFPMMCTKAQFDAGQLPFYEADYRGERIAQGTS